MSGENGDFWVIFPRRLSGARKMAGLSLRELSSRLKHVVSYQTLSNWEKGKGSELPPMAVIQKLGKLLGVRYDYFFQPIRESIPQPEFRRRKTKLGKKQEGVLLEQAQFALDRYLELEEITGQVIEVNNPVASLRVTSLEGVEEAANQLRELWEIGINPIPQVVEMLEERGIRVLRAEGPESFDGLAAWAGTIPFMLVNSNGSNVCRLRFTLLHELGHLFLNLPEGLEESEVEQYCNRFASAMLFPSKAFKAHFGEKRRHFSLQELISLKGEWGMSISAIMRRARDLDFISQEAYKRFCITYSSNGYRKDEPGEYLMQEKPMRFRQLVLRSFAEEVISGTKAAYFLNQSYIEFKQGCLIVA